MKRHNTCNKNSICLITSVHSVFDVRIFRKEARSLEKVGYSVTLIAQHEKTEEIDKIKIIGLPKPKNRFFRIFKTTWDAYITALRQKANAYHLHDPELILIGILLKFFTKAIVIFDIHENLPKQIQTKEWLPLCLRAPLSKIAYLFERLSLVLFDAIIVAGEDISECFPPSRKITLLRNFPQLEVIQRKKTKESKGNRPIVLIYAGGLSRSRGIKDMIESISFIRNNVSLQLLGSFDDPYLENDIKKSAGKQVKFIGHVSYKQVFQYLKKADIGLVLFHPTPNNYAAIKRNNKVFEYMAAGLPVLASNFPDWKKIIEGGGYGITVDPLNPKEIAKAIDYLIEHQDEAKKMGESGQKAILEKYNWETEKEKLLSIYEKLFEDKE